MGRVYLFADEAGNFDFRNKPGASRYFILGTLVIPNTDLGDRLLTLRRELAWQGVGLDSTFHATTDKQVVRNEVFNVLQRADFRFDATILEKPKTQPHLAASPERFYKMAWHLHFKYIGPQVVKQSDELLVIAASLGTKKRRKAIRVAIEDVVWQTAWNIKGYQVASWPAESDPCLQAADYCTWAVQRKWERGDVQSYSLIQPKIVTEFDVFADSSKTYY